MLDELSGPVDLICLPEMALVGYRFENSEDVAPYSEAVPADISAIVDQIDQGIAEEVKEGEQRCSFRWALEVSKRFAPAWVAVGFVERDDQNRFFNSALLVNHQLRACHVVRKVLAYEDDNKWATVEQTASGIEYNF